MNLLAIRPDQGLWARLEGIDTAETAFPWGAVLVALGVIGVVVLIATLLSQPKKTQAAAPEPEPEPESTLYECNCCGQQAEHYGCLEMRGQDWRLGWDLCQPCAHKLRYEVQQKAVTLFQHQIDNYNVPTKQALAAQVEAELYDVKQFVPLVALDINRIRACRGDDRFERFLNFVDQNWRMYWLREAHSLFLYVPEAEKQGLKQELYPIPSDWLINAQHPVFSATPLRFTVAELITSNRDLRLELRRTDA